jgi:hypothetical protein
MTRSVLTVFFLGMGLAVFSQDPTRPDSVIISADTVETTTADTVNIKSYAERFSPRKALLYSAILPGAGQAYNRKYWKVPVVYTLIGGGAFYIWLNDRLYQKYKGQLFSLLNEPARVVVDSEGFTPSGNILVNGVVVNAINRLGVEQLRNIVNRYRRDRDFGILMTGVVYFLQLLDAHVDAHLKEFDLNPQLKVTVEPSVQSTGFYGRASGLSLKFKF